MSNFTIINYALYVLGPMHEATLTSVLLLFQVASSSSRCSSDTSSPPVLRRRQVINL